jgi:peptide/nickel transport system substrate-binding protein
VRTWRRSVAQAPFLAVVVVSMVLAAGCSSDDNANDAAKEPAVSQTLAVGVPEDAYQVGGPAANVGQYPLNGNIYEGLVRMTPDYQVLPVLATSWQFVAPNTWRFNLRSGVTFHDGQPFNAAAVKFTFDRIAQTASNSLFFGPDSTKVVNDTTVEVTPTRENRRLVEQLVHPQWSIVAPGTNPGEKTVGTGPFKFVSYKPKESLVVERNPGYWGGAPKLEQITFTFIPDQNSRRLALESGAADVILDVPREAVAPLKGKGFQVVNSEPGEQEAIFANISGIAGHTIMQDSAVRHAIGYAIDRRPMLTGVLENQAVDEQTWLPGRLLGPENVAKIKGYTYDRAKAEQLLQNAGWVAGSDGVRQKDGKRLSLDMVVGFPTAEVHGSIPEFLQDQLRKVGIETKIVKTPDRASNSARVAAGDGDLFLVRGSQNDTNPTFHLNFLFFSKGPSGQTGYARLVGPGGKVDDLIAQSLADPDSAKVKALAGEAWRVLVDDEAIVVPLAAMFRINATAKTVKGFVSQPSDLQVLFNEVSRTAG